MPENEKENPKDMRDSLREQLEERLSGLDKAEPSGRSHGKDKKLPKKRIFNKKRWNFRRRVGIQDITTFCEELVLLLNTGLPLVPAMKMISQRGTNPALSSMIEDMTEKIKGGTSFSEAASGYKREFGDLFIGMFRAGERSGTLVKALQRVADRGEHIMMTRHRLISVLIYPAIVVLVAIGVIVFAFSFMMQTFKPLMEELDLIIPWNMQFILNAGVVFRTGSFWLTVAVLIAAVSVLYLLSIQFLGFRLVRDRFLIRCPFISRFVKQSAVSNFGRIFSTMLNAGVSLPESLQAAHDTTKNEVVRLAIDRTQKAVQEGGRVAPPLKRENIFPPLAHDMIDVGEEGGDLASVFARIAEIYEEKETNDLEILGKLIQPAIIVVLALIVGFIVLSLFQTYATLLGQLPGGI